MTEPAAVVAADKADLSVSPLPKRDATVVSNNHCPPPLSPLSPDTTIVYAPLDKEIARRIADTTALYRLLLPHSPPPCALILARGARAGAGTSRGGRTWTMYARHVCAGARFSVP